MQLTQPVSNNVVVFTTSIDTYWFIFGIQELTPPSEVYKIVRSILFFFGV